jgi:hypothetical protein
MFFRNLPEHLVPRWLMLSCAIAAFSHAANATNVGDTLASNTIWTATFLPMVGSNAWGTINASGNNPFINIRYAEIFRGAARFWADSEKPIFSK